MAGAPAIPGASTPDRFVGNGSGVSSFPDVQGHVSRAESRQASGSVARKLGGSGEPTPIFANATRSPRRRPHAGDLPLPEIQPARAGRAAAFTRRHRTDRREPDRPSAARAF